MCVCVFSVQRRATSRFLQLNICLIYHGVHKVAHNEMLLNKQLVAALVSSVTEFFQSAAKTWLVIQMNGESSTATMGKKNKNKKKQLRVTALRASESRTHGDRTVQSNRSQRITAMITAPSCHRRRLAAHAQTGSRCSSTPDLHARC